MRDKAEAVLIQAEKAQKTERDPDSHIEQVLDLGFVGEPSAVDTSVLDALLKSNSQLIPVVAPVGGGGSESACAPNESSAVVLGETGGELVHHLDVVGR